MSKAANKAKATKKDIDEEEEEKTSKVTTKAELVSFDDFVDGLGSWKDAMKKYWSSGDFKTLFKFLEKQYSSEKVLFILTNTPNNNKVYPPANLVFNAFKLTPITKIRVVIIGQDPYHQPGQAMGLSFSVPKGIKVPPSLQNIYKSLESDPDMKGFKKPSHGDLTKWATQGVFMLNAVLTVQDSKPNSHKKEGWNSFTDGAIKAIDAECEKIVFLLWGADAQKKATGINAAKHCILKTSHPSGLSYTKGFNTAYPFSKCNKYLKENGFAEIDWKLD